MAISALDGWDGDRSGHCRDMADRTPVPADDPFPRSRVRLGEAEMAYVDVGTGEPLQVPSLRAIAYRAPYMHNGCALTLRDRFSPSCGGTAHGNTGDLQPGQVDDLVAYLRTL